MAPQAVHFTTHLKAIRNLFSPAPRLLVPNRSESWSGPRPGQGVGEEETAFRRSRPSLRVPLGIPLSAADLLGIVGMVTLLAGFLGNLAGRIPAKSRLYAGLNFVGSGILAVYSVLIQAWVFFPLEVVWALAALWSLVKPAQKMGTTP